LNYKGQAKAYLVSELALEQAQERIQIMGFQQQDDFSGLVDAGGILISGPRELVGKKLFDILGISLSDIRPSEISERSAPGRDIPSNSVAVAGGRLLGTGLSLIRVEPASRYVAGASPLLWIGVFLVWLFAIVMMLVSIVKGFGERYGMYKALEDAHHNLESRVEQRTAELAQTNLELNREMAQREKAQQCCAASEARYRELAELLPQIVFETDAAGRFTFVNRSGLTATGHTTRDLAKGLNIVDVISPSDRARAAANFESVMRGGAPPGEEYEVLRQDGGAFTIAAYTAPIMSDKRIVGLRGVAVDMTEMKRIQRELLQGQKLQAIGTLAGGIAHEFNNMLTVIQGFSELLLLRSDEKDPGRADLEKILKTAKRAAQLVRQILTFSRKQEIQLQPMNLNQEVQEILKMLSQTLPKSVAIETRYGDDLRTINADSSQIQQVLLNLVINAKDSMPNGGKLVIETSNFSGNGHHLTTRVGDKPHAYVVLKISDTGEGMEQVVLDHIFEPFYTTKETGRGTGLGLSVVLGIVQSHGGHITCESKPGRGATFAIYLPALDGSKKTEVKAPDAFPPWRSETVLPVNGEASVPRVRRTDPQEMPALSNHG